jgi:uncharacterized membrane protein YidH (DUF202 family)
VTPHSGRPWFTDWLAGLTTGAGSGFLFAIWPTLGAGIALAFVAGVALTRRRRAPVGGFLVGLPGVWLLLIGNATLACQRFNEVPGQGCEYPDVTGWVIVAIGLLILGMTLTLAAVRAGRVGSR